MDWPRSTWHFRHRYVSDAWSDQVMVSTITCTQWLVQMKGADCRAYQKLSNRCVRHIPLIKNLRLYKQSTCDIHMIAWCIILFHQCLSLLVLLPGGPYCSIHTSLYQLCKKYISYSKTTNQQSTSFFNLSIMAKIPEWLSLESYRNF